MKDLGTMNVWREEPPEYKKHLEEVKRGEKHEVTGRVAGRCFHEMTCKTCGITWAIDSSD